AKKIVHDSTSEREQVFAVLSWVFHQVMGNVPEGKKEFAIKPKGIAFRGYGLSESSAYLFITLLQQLRIPAQLLQLRKKEGERWNNITALTRVYLENEWYVFDTLAGVPLIKSDGNLLSYPECIQHPELLDQVCYGNQSYYFSAKSFDQIQPLLVLPPRSFFPKIREFQKILDQVQGPVLYINLAEEAKRSGLPEKDWLTQTSNLDLWTFPFELLKESHNPKYLEARDQGMKEVYIFFQARILQIVGEYQSAETHYQQFLKTPQFVPSEDFLYFHALNLWESGQTEDALKHFQSYLEQYPEGCWSPKVYLYLGILLFPKSPESAKNYFQKIALPLKFHLLWKYPQFFQ
ncbi:MAG: transglutaminase domain-containing protein, partial [Planctomycetota bacterium]